MKKLLFIVLLFTGLVSQSQTYTAIHNYQAPDGLSIVKVLGIPNGADTSLAAAIDSVFTNDGTGWHKNVNLFFQTSDNVIYVHKGKWIAVGSGGSTSGGYKITYLKYPLYAYNDSTIAIYHADGLLSGGIVSWSGQGLKFYITPAVYIVSGIYYSSGMDSVTLSVSDPTNPRQYVIGVDTTGHAFFIAGTASPAPATPQTDPFSQVALTSGITLNAGATTPSTIALIPIYDENLGTPTEWAITTSGTITENSNSSANPFHGSKNINVSSYNKGSKIIATSAVVDTIINGEMLTGAIYFRGALPAANSFSFQFFNGATATTNALTVRNTFGFNPNDSNHYLIFSIPFSAFTSLIPTNAFNKLTITMTGADLSGVKGFDLDYLNLQTGVGILPRATDYSNKADSTTISGGFEYWWSKGISHLAGAVGGGSGGGNYHLPYNGNSGYYLGGDSALHVLPATSTGGISKILAGFGQLQKTDSSTNNDTTVMATVARLINDSSALKAGINTNTTNIATNTSNIASNTTNIASNTTAINLRVKYSDTAAMLAPYVRSIVLNTPNLIFSNPINFTVTSHAATGTLALNTQAANTALVNNSGGSATPVFDKMSIVTLKTTGTPSATTYLRGDSSWATPAGGGGGSSVPLTSVTAQKIYYRQEFVPSDTLNYSTGALLTTDTSNSVSGYLHVAGNESITISVSRNLAGSGLALANIYGWSYDTTLTAISEIRSNSLIGTQIGSYTFTTPSNARFINILVKYKSFDFHNNISINSTSPITFNVPIMPEQYSGSKSVPIQSAIDFARFTSHPVLMRGTYLVDSTLLLSSGSTIQCDGCKIKLDSASHTNIFRNEAVADPNNIFLRGNTNIKILGTGNAIIEGSTAIWGGGTPSGVGTQYWRSPSVLLANVKGFEVSGITFRNTNSWAVGLEQSRMGLFKNIKFFQDESNPNQDGIDIRRGSNKIVIDNISGFTSDDFIALTNLGGYTNYNILADKRYIPYDTSLDIHDIFISNINRDTSGIFGNGLRKAGILLLTADSLKIHDVSISNVSGTQQVQVGLSGYGSTSQKVNDMYNIHLQNINSPVNFDAGLPLKNSSFINILRGTNIPIQSKNISIKYKDSYAEYYDSIFLGSGVNSMTSNKFTSLGYSVVNTNNTGTSQIYLRDSIPTSWSKIIQYNGIAGSSGLTLDSSLSIQSANNVNIMAGASLTSSTTNYVSWRLGYLASSEQMRLDNGGLTLWNSKLGIGQKNSGGYFAEIKSSTANPFFQKWIDNAGDYGQLYSTSAGLFLRSLNVSNTLKDFIISGQNLILKSGTSADVEAMRVKSNGGLLFTATNTVTGTTGAQTINKISGTVNIAAAGTSVVVTNSLVATTSIVFAVIRTNDATARIANVVPAVGSFTINLTAATTAETSIGFFVIN